MRMMSPVQTPSSSNISDLLLIISAVKDAKKFDKLIFDLKKSKDEHSEEINKYEVIKSETEAALRDLQDRKQKIEEQEFKLGELKDKCELVSADIKLKKEENKKKESELNKKEKDLESKALSLEADNEIFVVSLEEKEGKVALKEKEASDLIEKYNLKIEGLKAVML